MVMKVISWGFFFLKEEKFDSLTKHFFSSFLYAIIENMEYRWFSFLLIGLLLFFILLTIILRNKRIVAGILISLATIILIWKTIEFSYYAINHTGTYPIEISHISYFVFGVIILSGLTKFYFTAGIFGFISGLGYMVAGIVSPASVVTSLPTHLFVMGIISHMILLFGGMLTLFSFTKYEMKRFYFPLIGLVLVFIFAYLVDQKYIDFKHRNLFFFH